MYLVYAENYDGSINDTRRYLLYAPTMVAHGYSIFSAKPASELGKAGSFPFMMSSTHPEYEKTRKLSTIVSIFDDEELLWRGRVLDTKRDFHNNKTVTCEGELAFLNDVLFDAFDYEKNGIEPETFFSELMTAYEKDSSDYRKIEAGEFHYDGDNRSSKDEEYDDQRYDGPKKIFIKCSDHKNILSLLNEYLVNRIGGFLKIRYEYDENNEWITYLDYYGSSYIDRFQEKKDSGDGSVSEMINSQIISFGKNLIDFEEYINAANTFTCIVPLGAKIENPSALAKPNLDGDGRWSLKNYSYSYGEDGEYSTERGDFYISHAPAVSMFGKIITTVIYDDFNNIDDSDGHEYTPEYLNNKLFNKAIKELDNATNAAFTITINAVDLTLLGVNADRLKTGQYVRVVSIPHGLDSYYLVSKIELDILNPENSVYMLGIASLTFTEKQVKDNQNLNLKIAGQ